MELENVYSAEIVFVLALTLVSPLVALLGKNREIGYGGSLLCCLICTSILGLIIILCSEKNSTREERLREERARDFVIKKIWDENDPNKGIEVVREMIVQRMTRYPSLGKLSLSDLRNMPPYVIFGFPEGMIFKINNSYRKYLKEGYDIADAIDAIEQKEEAPVFKSSPSTTLNVYIKYRLEKEYPLYPYLSDALLSASHLFIKDKMRW